MFILIKGIVAILVALLNLLLALLVLFRNPRRLINVIFFFIAISFCLWSLFLFFYEFPLIFSSLFWIKAVYVMVIVFILLALLFSFVFPWSAFRKMRKYAWIAGILYLFSSIWILFFTKFWVADVTIDAKGLQTVLGSAYKWWALTTWFFVLWMVVNFIIKTRKANPLQKIQMQYFWAGFVLYSLGASFLDAFVPLVWHDTSWFALSTVTALFFSGATAYAILKHRFMDIRQVVARSMAYVFLVLSLGVIYCLGLFLTTSFIIREPTTTGSLAISTLFAVIIAFSFQPLLNFFRRITNRIFYKQHYDEAEVLHELSLIMSSTINLSDLTHNLLNKIRSEMRISRGAFVLVDNKRVFHLASEGYRKEPQFSSGEVRRLIQKSEISVFDELPEDDHLKDLMRRLDISVIVPLRTKTEQEDVLLLGEKRSGGPYTIQDISLLEIFAPSAAVAINNASSVERLLRMDEIKSEFITVVSHQLRTPLSVVRWNFELLLDGSFGRIPAKAKNVLSKTYKELMDFNQGLNNLMGVLEIEEGKSLIRREKVEINQDIIEEAIKDLEEEIKKKNINVRRRLSFKKIIFVDRQKIKKVFENVLNNAVCYSPEGSTVVISTVWRKEDDRDELQVSVEDSGIGIAPENRELIFQKFFRGEEAKKMWPPGFGLGLFIARSYVEFHGGRLWLEEKEGPGSIFVFTIPLGENSS